MTLGHRSNRDTKLFLIDYINNNSIREARLKVVYFKPHSYTKQDYESMIVKFKDATREVRRNIPILKTSNLLVYLDFIFNTYSYAIKSPEQILNEEEWVKFIKDHIDKKEGKPISEVVGDRLFRRRDILETFSVGVLAHKLIPNYVDLLSLRAKYHIEGHMLCYLRDHILRALSLPINDRDDGSWGDDDLFIKKLENMPAFVKHNKQLHIMEKYPLQELLNPVTFYKEVKVIIQRINKQFYEYYNEKLLNKVKKLYKADKTIDPGIAEYLEKSEKIEDKLVKAAILRRWLEFYPSMERKKGQICFYDLLKMYSDGKHEEIANMFTIYYDNRVKDNTVRLGKQVIQYIEYYVSIFIIIELRQKLSVMFSIWYKYIVRIEKKIPYMQVLGIDGAIGQEINYFIDHLDVNKFNFIYVDEAPKNVTAVEINKVIAMLEQMHLNGYALLRLGFNILDRIENKDDTAIYVLREMYLANNSSK
jgi:hypothetical protein